MKLLQAFRRPQYVLRPKWAARRLLIKFGLARASDVVRLPWDEDLHVDVKDSLGWALATQGIYDLVTTEVLWRLTETGSTMFDIGANIGYFTTLMAFRAGPSGKVIAFEPHPETIHLLRSNVSQATYQNIQIENVALSSEEGEAALDNFPGEERNTSYSFLTTTPTSNAVTVKAVRGERYVTGTVQLMKIDAQWHEVSVLEGFGEAVHNGSIRDIVFEEEAPYPAPSHKLLLGAGYRIFWFDQRISGPVVVPPDQRLSGIQSYEIAPSYLATRNESRAFQLLSKPGWQCLRSPAVSRGI